MINKIQKLIFSKYNSIVVVDDRNAAVGFISIRDILETVAQLHPQNESIPLIFEKPSGSVKERELHLSKEMILRMGRKIQKRTQIEKIEVTFEEPKYTDGETAVYNTTIIVTPLKGEKLVAKSKHSIFINAVSEAISEINRLEEKAETKHTAISDSYASI